MKNKNAMAIQLALQFVGEHKEQFEKWVNERACKNHISHLDKVFGIEEGMTREQILSKFK